MRLSPAMVLSRLVSLDAKALGNSLGAGAGRIVSEVAAWAVAIGFLLYQARSAFILGVSSIGHDNLYWFYPVYQFFAGSLLQGRFPYWDPFTNGGQALYPVLLHLRLLEPVSYLVLVVGGLITHDLTTLFNWDRLARTLVGAVGVHLLLRQWTEFWMIRLLLPPLLVWSSLQLTAFHQTATIDHFISAPWASYFLFRIWHTCDLRWRNWIGLAVSIGVAWQSYYFAGLWVLFLFLGVGFVLFRRSDIRQVLTSPGVMRKAALAAFVIALMALPNAVVFAERSQWVFPARMLDYSYEGRRPEGGPLQYEPRPPATIFDSLLMPYGAVHYTGTFSSLWDFIQMLTPEANRYLRGDGAPSSFGTPSEVFLSIGLLGYLGALVGVVAGQHHLKRVWLVATAGFALLMLGPSGGLHQVLQLYPPLWAVRHTHVFGSFFVLGLMYFFILGCNRLVLNPPRLADLRPVDGLGWRWTAAILGCSVVIVGSAVGFLAVTSRPRALPMLNWEVLLILGPIVVLFLFRGCLGQLGLIIVLLVSHITVVLIYSPRPLYLATHLAAFLVLPAILLLVGGWAPLVTARPLILAGVALLLLIDLGSQVARASWLWHWPRPDRVLKISPFPVRPEPLLPRVVTLPSEYMYQAYPQPIRYVSLVARRPVSFSSVMYSAEEPEALLRSTPVVRPDGVWPSVWRLVNETWQPVNGRVMPPGAARPELDGSRLPAGSVAARVIRRAESPSELSISIPVTPDLWGRRLWAQIWVKSANRVPQGVQVEMDFGTRRVVRSYGNSGEWELLTLDGPAHADPVTVVARVRQTASTSALFDDLTLRVSPVEALLGDFDLDLVRSARRWSTLLMPAQYFEFVHADLPAAAFAEILALGKPAVQFRPNAHVVSVSDLAGRLRELGPEGSKRVLVESVFLHARLPGLETRSVQAGDQGATVTVRGYDYNSLLLTVEARSPGYVYLAEGFDRGWRATVDGRPSQVLRANIAFKAVSVPSGRHNVRLDYRPTAFRIALWTYFTVAGLALAGLVGFLFHQRN